MVKCKTKFNLEITCPYLEKNQIEIGKITQIIKYRIYKTIKTGLLLGPASFSRYKYSQIKSQNRAGRQDLDHRPAPAHLAGGYNHLLHAADWCKTAGKQQQSWHDIQPTRHC